jgi:hypothetical protein
VVSKIKKYIVRCIFMINNLYNIIKFEIFLFIDIFEVKQKIGNIRVENTILKIRIKNMKPIRVFKSKFS